MAGEPQLNWLLGLPQTQPAAHAVLVLCLVSLTGLALGRVKVRGIGLGTAGVLFAGILFGHLGQGIEPAILEFAKEFGLILFVFMIGLQLGPGFFASLRRQGFRLNALAAAVVLGSALLSVAAGWLFHIDFVAVLGLFSGATTNTPSLGAAQQALAALPGVAPDRASLAALAYAVAYPVGIVGIISSLLLLKAIFKLDTAAEAVEWSASQQKEREPVERRTLVIENVNLDGLALKLVPGLADSGVTVTRMRAAAASRVQAASPARVLHRGDVLLAVGPRAALDQFERIVGRRSDEDLTVAQGDVAFRRVLVTRKKILGRTLRELALPDHLGVTVTRVARNELELAAFPDLRLQFGDVLHLVGEDGALNAAALELGNSAKALNETQFIAIFMGIALGIVLGVLPVAVPGLPQPVKLGLAGGPLLLAILVSRVGNIGPLVWYMPPNANLAFRELGITLFLACVGLKAGDKFFSTVFTTTGATWVAAAVVISMLPLLVAGCFARWRWKMNYLTLSGLLAGSMTDPPALAFAGNICRSEAPSVAYATVYPLTMLLRIVCAQVLALLLCG